MHLSDNAFNGNAHGPRGFELLGQVADQCDFYEFSYGRLEEAVKIFAALIDDAVLPADGR